MFEAFLEPEVSEIVGAEFVAQEGGELLVLFEESIFPVGAEDMMAVLDLLQGGVELAWQAAGEAARKQFPELLWGGRPKPPHSSVFAEARGGAEGPPAETCTELDLVTAGVTTNAPFAP